MRQLHFVDSDKDSGRVVLATSDGLEQFEVSVDQELRAAVTGMVTLPAEAAAAGVVAPSGPKLSPREIQVRVRSGATAQSLADECGASLDWVLRFAAPVLAERARIADEARRAKARRSTTEGQTVVFGEAVDERFAGHGIDPSSVKWDAHRREDGQWIITARWVGGQSEHTAEWGFQLSARTVAPLDDTAADLLSDRPIRPIAPATPPSGPNLTLAPPLAPGVVAFPAMPETHTGPLPRPDDVFDQERFEEQSSAPAAEPAAAAATTPEFDEPLLPMHVPGVPTATTRIPRIPAARRAESDEEKAARATIPSWDDILLGVRRKQD